MWQTSDSTAYFPDAYDDSDVIFKWLSGDVHVSRTNMAQFKFLGAMFSADLDSYTGGKIMKS